MRTKSTKLTFINAHKMNPIPSLIPKSILAPRMKGRKIKRATGELGTM